jgi:hypothetical protein
VTRAALYLAALLASLAGWRRPSLQQVPIVVALCLLFVVDASRPFLAPWPTLYVAGFVVWFGVTTWAVESTLAPAAPRTGQAFAVLACSSGTALRFDATAELARASFALALAAQLLAVARFASRGKPPDDAQRVALILAASSLADIAGPWLCGAASKDWHAGKWPAVITWIAVAIWEAKCLTRARKRRGTF